VLAFRVSALAVVVFVRVLGVDLLHAIVAAIAFARFDRASAAGVCAFGGRDHSADSFGVQVLHRAILDRLSSTRRASTEPADGAFGALRIVLSSVSYGDAPNETSSSARTTARMADNRRAFTTAGYRNDG
jgi:hypothetical protein